MQAYGKSKHAALKAIATYVNDFIFRRVHGGWCQPHGQYILALKISAPRAVHFEQCGNARTFLLPT
jgi:hypothetical protein